MNKHSKILGAMFVVMVGYAAFSQVVYPKWIEPLLTIEERIADGEKRFNALEEGEARVTQARHEYKQFAHRIGSVDNNDVKNDVYRRLNDLIEKNNLEDAKINPSRRANTDRKKGWSRWRFDVRAQGTLQSVVKFLRDVSEMPHLLRINSPKIAPVSKSGRNKDKSLMNFRATIEVMVLHNQRTGNVLLTGEKLYQPEAFVRHQDRDYATIWNKEPFTEYEKPRPKPTKKTVKKDTKPPKKTESKPKVVDKRWKDRDRLLLVWVGGFIDSGGRRAEVWLTNTKSKTDQYVRVGDDFDGGTLLYVHQTGALVGREDGDFIYPIGEKLSRPVKAVEAGDYPELQLALERIRQDGEGDAAKVSEEAEADAGRLEVPNGDEKEDSDEREDSGKKEDPDEKENLEEVDTKSEPADDSNLETDESEPAGLESEKTDPT